MELKLWINCIKVVCVRPQTPGVFKRKTIMSSESEMDAANAVYEKATSKNLSMTILGQQLNAQQEECLWNKILKIAANLSKVF